MKHARKFVAALAVAALLALPAVASAAWEGQGNSTPGGARYDAISSNPNPEAQCGTGGWFRCVWLLR